MSKQVQNPRKTTTPDEAVARVVVPTLDPALVEQGERGNQALQAQLGEVSSDQEPSLDPVRDAALPFVERTFLALQILPRHEALVERFAEILTHATLAASHRDELLEKLRNDHVAALHVSRAVQDVLGVDGEAERAPLVSLFDALWTALSEGQATASGWLTPAGDQVLWEQGGEPRAAAEGLIRALAQTLASPELTEALGARAPGDAAVSIGRAISLAVDFDEEEDDDLDLSVEIGS